ncbi:BAG family molecular chaperone regulator 6 [Salvia miltiorrhiza]|uniref:BAG family molecular chaperone regulator 6 n=1 Tax=Salvia miltiorrhiza TaxID=226208 RepID=UPI0025ABA67A|nr:BAG family molecular chaperone regulator 6 [Salvia miltiorrhiza]
MEPVYMNMQSYPHQNGQVHYRPCGYPGMEARPPMSYESWPWGGNYGYAPPGACHACCNHAYMPAHCAWGSPYSHVPPHHFPGHYPYNPVHYMLPPPYPVMDRPRYEYEKGVPVDHHCCGYRNQPLHQKEQGNVRIEEEEPEREARKNVSLVPSQLKNSPSPNVWLPPDYNDGGKVKGTEVRKDTSRDVKEPENRKTVEQQPSSWNGWLPLDLNNVVSLKEKGDAGLTSQQDDGKRNFQFPFFWIPYKPHDTERENQEVKDGHAKLSLEPEKGSGGDHVDGGDAGNHSASRVKDIPVKEVEQHVGKESSINLEKEGDTSAKIRTDNGEKRNNEVERVPSVEGSKKKSPSPPKPSKLPPVCLRVDPLPRKKSANAKSRSPSPPGDKQKLEVKSNEAVRSPSPVRVKESTNKKAIAVVDGNTSLEKSTNVNVETPGKPPAKSEDDISTKQAEEIARNYSETYAARKEQSEDTLPTGGQKEESFQAEEADEGKKCRQLSEEEAAVIIQSAYRRFDVRRWKPIEKLRQIARVRAEIADVKSLIQEMESSSDIQSRAKQKNIISETIMNLLLRLDTIQGLHPSIREVRKSVVKELVSLQEQLDTIICKEPENSPGEESLMRHDQEDSSSRSEDIVLSVNSNKIDPVGLQNQVEGGSDPERPEFPAANPTEEAASVITGAEPIEEAASVISGSCVDEGLKSEQGPTEKDEHEKSAKPIEEAASVEIGAKSAESSVNPFDEAASLEIGAEAAESSVDEGVKSAQGPTTKQEEEKSTEVLENNETSIAKEDRESIILGQGSKLSSLLGDSSAGATNVAQTEDHELPRGVLDDICAAEGTNHYSAAEADSSKADQSPQLEASLTRLPIAVEENHQTVETQETEKGGFSEKHGMEEEADNETGDAASEPNEHMFQQPIADKLDPSEQGAVDTNHPPRKEGIDAGEGEGEMSRKMMEEKERLREMVAELIKAGHEQLTAISSLSGRVKDLEKKLSRKKKLKVKQLRAPRASCNTKGDTFGALGLVV